MYPTHTDTNKTSPNKQPSKTTLKPTASSRNSVRIPVEVADVGRICSMTLLQGDVAKVTTDAITHLHFMPSNTYAILAAGMWNVVRVCGLL